MSDSSQKTQANAGRDKGAKMREVLWFLCTIAELDPEWMTELLMEENFTTPRKWSLMTYTDLHELSKHSNINDRVIVDLLRMRDWLTKWKDANLNIKWSTMELKDWKDELDNNHSAPS